MRKLREVLRLSLVLGLGPRAISRSCELSSSTVSGYVWRARVAKLIWPLPAELDDDTAPEVPHPASSPLGITAGPDGNLWFTESNGHRIGQITPDGVRYSPRRILP